MSKTIVNIITDDDPIAAYLFIKDAYREGDRLMFISARDTIDDLNALARQFAVPPEQVEAIVLKNDRDKITYEHICRSVKSHLKEDEPYCVNLAGGTHYMALAVQQVFERFKSVFFYLSVDDNLVVHSIFDDSIFDDDDHFYSITHRMTAAEYLRIHSIKCDQGLPIRTEQESRHIFDLFVHQRLKPDDFAALETLRTYYHDRKRLDIAKTESRKEDGHQNPPVPHLSQLLKNMGFTPQVDGILDRHEIAYITGGWFEEYAYYLIKDKIQPDDIAINVEIQRSNSPNKNELDVVFTKGNKLFVIECKTGVQTERMFNQIVYKACAIKEAMLGVSCHSFIFSLRRDDDNDTLERMARNMGITFVDHETLTTPEPFNKLLANINALAKEPTD